MFFPDAMCENCPEDEIKLIPLRFIGGADKGGRKRGPYRSYAYGDIYMMRPGYADVPWFEHPDAQGEEKEAEPGDEYINEIISPPPSAGLTKSFNKGDPLTDNDFVLGMDDATLKHFIVGQGGKVDGRWGRDKLIEEARKLQ